METGGVVGGLVEFEEELVDGNEAWRGFGRVAVKLVHGGEDEDRERGLAGSHEDFGGHCGREE